MGIINQYLQFIILHLESLNVFVATLVQVLKLGHKTILLFLYAAHVSNQLGVHVMLDAKSCTKRIHNNTLRTC